MIASTPVWLDPSSYNDRDLSATIMSLPALFDQLLTGDGRGLESVEVSSDVQAAVRTALKRLDRTPMSHSFTEACAMLAALVASEGFRGASDAAVQQILTEWSATAKRLRLQRMMHLRGSVAGLFTSAGGVPKKPIDVAVVGPRGVQGDKQASRVHHGRPWQALCVWSKEVIDRLNGEGHPVAPGFAGENVLLEGIDWAEAKPGTVLRIGTVVAEVTNATLPCKKNAPWFLDGKFSRMHHATEAGVSRMYAAVVTPGVVTVGDTAIVEQR